MIQRETNETPLVSVLMPVYNGEAYLREAIDSIIHQTYTTFELLLINDGSTDSSEIIALSYSDIRIKYIKNESNIGLIKTLNKGIGLAKGKYIARMDADDISSIERLSTQVSILESRNIDVISSSVTKISSIGAYIGIGDCLECNNELTRFMLMFGNPINHPAVTVRTSIMHKFKYRESYDAIHVEDYDLWSRMAADPLIQFAITAIPLLCYRRTGENITERHLENLLKSSAIIARQMQLNQLGHAASDNLNNAIILRGFDRSVSLDVPNAISEFIQIFNSNSATLPGNWKRNLRKWVEFRSVQAIFQIHASRVTKLKVAIKFPIMTTKVLTRLAFIRIKYNTVFNRK